MRERNFIRNKEILPVLRVSSHTVVSTALFFQCSDDLSLQPVPKSVFILQTFLNQRPLFLNQITL